MVAEGYNVQFVVLADVNATDFVGRTSVPIFRDDTKGRTAWQMMEPGAGKHDTFVYGTDGVRTLFWDTTVHKLGLWGADIRVAVEALGK